MWSPWETVNEVRDEGGRLLSFARTRSLITKAGGPSVTARPAKPSVQMICVIGLVGGLVGNLVCLIAKKQKDSSD
jgi:hypothetical protein